MNLLAVIAAPRRTNKQSFLAACFFAIQLAAACGLIHLAYHFFNSKNHYYATSAVVSTVLVLYPGIAQSFSAAILRIWANLLGAGIGLAVAIYLGYSMLQVVLALMVIIFVGEFIRLDLALRSACVAAVIVMTTTDHNVTHAGAQRIIAVTIGCFAAMIIQLAVLPFREHLSFVALTEAVPNDPKPASDSKTVKSPE